jgi:hypothetical protein
MAGQLCANVLLVTETGGNQMETRVWRAIGSNRFAKVIITDSDNKILAKGETEQDAREQIQEEGQHDK